MTISLIINVIFFAWASYETLSRIKRHDTRIWLRIPAAFISLYCLTIYSLALFDIIPDLGIRLFMRWFMVVVALYIILEAKHG